MACACRPSDTRKVGGRPDGRRGAPREMLTGCVVPARTRRRIGPRTNDGVTIMHSRGDCGGRGQLPHPPWMLGPRNGGGMTTRSNFGRFTCPHAGHCQPPGMSRITTPRSEHLGCSAVSKRSVCAIAPRYASRPDRIRNPPTSRMAVHQVSKAPSSRRMATTVRPVFVERSA